MNTATETGLRVEPVHEEGAAILNVAGDVDAANAHQLREAVIAAIEMGPPVVVVDLTSGGLCRQRRTGHAGGRA